MSRNGFGLKALHMTSLEQNLSSLLSRPRSLCEKSFANFEVSAFVINNPTDKRPLNLTQHNK